MAAHVPGVRRPSARPGRGASASRPACGRGLQSPILQYERGDAVAVQPFGHFYALVVEPQDSQSAAWGDDDPCAGRTGGIRQEHR